MRTLNRCLVWLNFVIACALVMWLTFGCAPARSAANVEICRAKADETLRVNAVNACSGSPSFEACPAHDALLADYRKALRDCR
jgi:hypothetical protein